MKNLNLYFLIGIFILLIFSFIQLLQINKNLQEEITIIQLSDTIDLSLLDLNKDNFFYVCALYEIQYPEIVYAQAQLESGNFTSNVFKTKNNFLGLYNTSKSDYYHFNHWSDCLIKYKVFVQNKYNCGSYYTFLSDLPYATDPKYIQKVQQLVKQNN